MRATTPVHAALGLTAAVTMAVLLALAPAAAPSRAAHVPAGRSPGAGLQATATEAPTGTLSCVPPPNGMVAWWRFELKEQEEGDPAPPAFYADLAGVHNDATVVIPPVPSIGYVGNGLQFDGAVQSLEAEDHPEIDFGTGDFTIDAWVRQPPDAMGVRTILDKRAFDPVQGYAFFTYDGNVSLQLGDASAAGNGCSSNPAEDPCTNWNSGLAINDGEWHFVAVTVARSGAAHFYVDGETRSFPASIRALSLDNAAPLRIGQHAEQGGLWKGDIDEVELFGRALDDAELEAIYRAGPAGKCVPDGAPMCPEPSVAPVVAMSANGGWNDPGPCQPMGARELVNIDAVNLCGGQNAVGFKFTLSDFQDDQGNAYNGSSTDFSIESTYEDPKPGGNPFTTPKAVPTYQTPQPGQLIQSSGIVLQWHNYNDGVSVPKVVGNATPAHFGYSLGLSNPNSQSLAHKVRADWLLNGSSATPCSSALVESAQWSGAGNVSVELTLQNPSPDTTVFTTWGFVSPLPVPLGGMMTDNDGLWRMAGDPLKRGTLAPDASFSVSLPIDRDKWGVVVITEWRDLGTNALRARSFRALPFRALALPTTTPSSPTATRTATALPVTTQPPQPTATSSSTPLLPTTTPSPSPIPTASSETTAVVVTPTVAPTTDAATPVLVWRLFMPALLHGRD